MELPLSNDDAPTTQNQNNSGLWQDKNFQFTLALFPLLGARFFADGPDIALRRFSLLVVAFVIAYGWSAVFAKRIGNRPNLNQLDFAILFTALLPAPPAWGGAIIAISFGWVFAHEIFGSKGFIPPALLALAFGIFSYSGGGYESKWLYSAEPNLTLAVASVLGGLWLVWKNILSIRVVAGVVLGAGIAAASLSVPEAPQWWQHLAMGTFIPGILFLAAKPQSAPRIERAKWVYGAIIGGLIIVIRLAGPDQPDGVVLAILLGILVAPLVDRAFGWRPEQ